MSEVTVTVVRDVDGIIIDYVRECNEADLDGVLAAEDQLPGTVTSIEISPPQ
jgi:hypothetical protein